MTNRAIPVSDVIDAMGGLTKAAAALGIDNPSVIANWKKRNRIPVDRVIDVERVSGISRHELRPDLSAIFISKEPASNGEEAA